MNELIAKLAALFKSREQIDQEIANLLGESRVGGGDSEKKEHIKKLKDFVIEKKSKNKNGVRECSDCGLVVKNGDYFCKGRCADCYQKDYRRKKGMVEKNKNDDSQPVRYGRKYECLDCFEKFTSTLNFEEVRCPNNLNHKIIQK